MNHIYFKKNNIIHQAFNINDHKAFKRLSVQYCNIDHTFSCIFRTNNRLVQDRVKPLRISF